MGNTMAPIVTKPINILAAPALSEAISSGIQPPLTNYLVDNLVPTLTETITDTMIETLSDFLSEYITEHMTPVSAQSCPDCPLLNDAIRQMTTEGVSGGLIKTLAPEVPCSAVPAVLCRC